MTKPKANIDDPRVLAKEVMRKTGGLDGFVSWAKSNRTLWYQLYPKLMAQPAQVNINNNNVVKIADGEKARAHLYDSFCRIIDARQHPEDPAVIVDGVRVIEHQPLLRDTRPATVVDVETSRDTRPATPAAKPSPIVEQPVAASREPNRELSTTEKWYEWNGGSSWGRRGSDWGPVYHAP